MQERERKEEKIISIALILLAIVFWIIARNYREDGTYVRVILVLLITLSTINLIKQFLPQKKLSVEEKEETVTLEDQVQEKFLTKQQVGLCLAIVLYLVGFYVIGFFPSTAAFMLGVPFLLGYRNKLVVILTAVGVSLVVYLIFFVYLNVYPITGMFF